MDLINKCLLCLQHNNNNKNILSQDEDCIVIEEKLKYVLPDENITSYYYKIVNHKPQTPKNICTACLEELNSVYKFKQKCFKNFKYLSDSLEDHSTSLLKQELLKVTTPKQNNYAIETVVIKVEPEEIPESTKVEEEPVNEVEEIVVKGEPLEELHNEIDIKEDPLSVEATYSYSQYTTNTGYVTPPLTDDPLRPYRCPVCKKAFKTAKYLSTHQHIHSGEKPFACDICDKRFRNRYQLISHKYIHTGGEKPFKCRLCNLGFLSQSHLTVHERVHTGEKPFKCEVCGKAFTQRNILKTHLRTHSGVKPYECDVCEKAFGHKKTLRAHKRTHVVYKGFEAGGQVC